MAKKEKKKLSKFEKWFRFLLRLEPIVYRPFFPFKKYKKAEYGDGPYIVVGNHYSVLDVVFAVRAISKPIHFIAKKELFEKGLMRKFVLKCQCIPVNRDGNDIKAVMQSMKYLKNGESIAIFPEGTRNKSNEIFLPFKSGATALSIKTKTPIIPFIQIKKLRFLRRSHVLYGEPLEFAEYYDRKITEKEISECDEILLNKMHELYNELLEMRSKKKKKKKQ
ncbi:MAG: 1-acyl-sn-glycerol-3-phosphate acyltransferase [Clostridia bacterium]|nr:1-acyl-sn-glycerol-3-phosphate acyltransferase [Clostridia bacterium]